MRASNFAKASATASALALVLGERKQGGRVTSGYAGNNRVFLCHARHLRRRLNSAAPPPRRLREPRKFLTIPRSKLSARPKPARKAGLPNIGVLQAQPTATARSASRLRRDQMAARGELLRGSRRPFKRASDRFRFHASDFANTAPAVDRSEAASASSAASRGEPRLKTSLTRRDAPSPTIFRPAIPAPERRQSA